MTLRAGENSILSMDQFESATVSAPRKTMLRTTLSAGLFLFGAMAAGAQSAIYFDYPQTRGKVQPLVWNDLPSWLTLNAELRGRTEGQTSYDYTQDGDRIYELTRIYGGTEVRPTKFLTGYLQFIDTHALGLPTHVIGSNMRDAFDLRRGYLNLHLRPAGVPVRFVVGRQELKFGSERVIGISDWTNNSRSWDGFSARVGDKNRLDLFSTSVVTTHPRSLDTHGSGPHLSWCLWLDPHLDPACSRLAVCPRPHRARRYQPAEP